MLHSKCKHMRVSCREGLMHVRERGELLCFFRAPGVKEAAGSLLQHSHVSPQIVTATQRHIHHLETHRRAQ